VPFREKGLPTALQIENYNNGERNPYYHTPKDTIDYINIEYLLEQIKATITIANQLLGPIVE